MPAVHTDRVIMLLADGARPDVMEDLLAQGRLPHMATSMIGQGSFRSATTVFPSTTGPAYLPFLTGASPGPCNFPGIRWLDKARFAKGERLFAHRSYCGFESLLMGRDLAPHIQSLFQLVPDSFSIFSSLAKGAGSRNLTRFMKIWYWYYAHLTDRWGYADAVALDKIRDVLERRPEMRFLFAVLPGIDEYAHLAHPHHASVLRQYEYLDCVVGELVTFLRARGKWEGTQLWIVSDHGLSKTDHHF